ncbi:hypothetical protein Pmani_007461 [Petrolisthes manimaculis]|uniref:Uncharacterized protein n=1 Tax=Petrolisthes manimaculis TaxID=1843537 RepID=A0AAE1Q7P8_9EUCA|nr:hypothetical protein Pmani_007461 [Petrolisthes manimaculis]
MHWMLIKSTRSAIVTSVQEMAAIDNVDDPTDELRGASVRHDNSDVRKVITQIHDTCNEFIGTVSESSKLFNISTGKAASESIKACLLGIKDKGKDKKETFVAACLDGPERFESAIKKESLTSFTNENVVRELIEKLVANHEEVDTLIATYAKSIDEVGCVGNIVVRGSDTNIAVIL